MHDLFNILVADVPSNKAHLTENKYSIADKKGGGA